MVTIKRNKLRQPEVMCCEQSRTIEQKVRFGQRLEFARLLISSIMYLNILRRCPACRNSDLKLLKINQLSNWKINCFIV